MNIGKIMGGLFITVCIVCAAFGQQLKMERSGGTARVMQGRKVLYAVGLRGRANEKGRKFDEAFMAGACLIVRRDVRRIETGTESYPNLSRLEIYRANGRKRIYREANLSIARINDWDLINSPDFSWAIIPDNGEAMFEGYFYISPQCEIREIAFNPNDNFDWGDRSDAKFLDAETLKFSSVRNRVAGGQIKKTDIFITKDGKFRLENAK